MTRWNTLMFILFSMITPSCDKPDSDPPRDPVSEIFEKRLDELGFQFELLEDGRYDVDFGSGQVSTVSLQNKRKEFDLDPDPEIIYSFIDQVKRTNDQSNKSWEEVKLFIRYQLDSDDYIDFPDDVLAEQVAEDLLKVYVFVSSDEELITWISNKFIEKWGVGPETIKELADENMNALVSETKLEIQMIDGVPLGMLATEVGAFKASLLLAPDLKTLVSGELGFPVYAVAPDRDFVYLVPAEHTSFLGRLGPVVREQYAKSGYPISNKVFKISEAGLSIAGSFAERETPNE